MNILVYGVFNWDKNTLTKEYKDHCREWYDRIIKNIPYIKKVFVATGSYSDPEISPLPSTVPIIQNGVKYTIPYTNNHNYFKNGFLTGIWHCLLNEKDWDILIHVQSRVLIGDPLIKEIDTFYTRQEQIMAASLIGTAGMSIEQSFICMKPLAAQKYCTNHQRPSFTSDDKYTLNCEEEVYWMFHNTWYNPWPHIITTRQLDHTNGQYYYYMSPFSIQQLSDYKKLPFISTGYHAHPDFIQSWKDAHPC